MSIFKSDLYHGKVIFATGGGSGIGYAITRAMMQHGASAVILGRRGDVLNQAAAKLEKETGGKCLAVQGDVRKPESLAAAVKAAVDKFGRIDHVLCAAAGNFLSPIDGMSENAFATVMAIDTLGTYNTVKATIDQVKKTKGSFIAISATLHYKGTMLQAHVSAAKAAIDALFRVMAVEYGPFGVRANVVAPGGVEQTEGLSRLLPKAALDRARQSVPLGYAEVVDIENACLFLFSAAARKITGTITVVDGGELHTASQTMILDYPKDLLDTKGFREKMASKL